MKNIFLLESSLRRAEQHVAEHGEIECTFEFGTRLRSFDKAHFLVDATLLAAMVAPGSSSEIVNLRATFRLEYSLSEPRPREKLEAFAKMNTPFNVWPYWREYLHNLLARMDVPPIVLPVYRYGAVRKGAKARIRFGPKEAVES